MVLGRAVAFPSPVLLSPRARVKYCSFPPWRGKVGMGGQKQRRTLQATPGLTLTLPPCGSEGEVFHQALIGLVVAPAPTPGPPPTPQAACGRARSGARASSSHGGTVGHGSGTKAPGGKGAWRRKATNRATPPWRNTLTSRRRVARRVRGRSGHNAVTARSVLSGMSSSAIPPTLSSHKVAPATASHRRAARSGARMRVRCPGQPARWVIVQPCAIEARSPYQQASLASGGRAVSLSPGAVSPSAPRANRVPSTCPPACCEAVPRPRQRVPGWGPKRCKGRQHGVPAGRKVPPVLMRKNGC